MTKKPDASTQYISDLDNPVVCHDLEEIYAAFTEKEKLRGANIVITGCAGFLGYYFMLFFFRYAGELGIRAVTGLDNFQLGRPAWIDRLTAAAPELISVRSFDITSGSLDDAPAAKDADYVLHMASIASPIYYRKFPLQTVDANVWGLRRLLDAYKGGPLKGLLFFSSSEIYGDPVADQIPTPETYRGNVATMGPRACYDEAKRFGETLCYLYAKEHNMPVRIVRPFNNFGPGMKLDDRRAPADFASAVLEGRDIVIHSDGAPTRTFCYLTDALTGYLKTLVHNEFDVFNIGIDAPEIMIRELAAIFAEEGKKLCGYQGEVKYTPSQEEDYLTDNPNRRCPDISKAGEKLSFKPAVDVREGVSRYLRYHLAAKEAPVT